MSLPLFSLKSKTLSTSHSSSSESISITTGGGFESARLGKRLSSFSWYGLRSDAWNVRWTFQCGGRSSSKLSVSGCDLVISNGPYQRGESFECIEVLGEMLTPESSKIGRASCRDRV